MATSSTISSAANEIPAPPHCTTCSVSFIDGVEQRVHMKEDWHVYNVKRRMVSLPPLTQTVILQLLTESEAEDCGNSSSQSSENPDWDQEEEISPFNCLFCHQSANDRRDLTENLDHMADIHGFFIPRQEEILNMETFLGYLSVAARVWHECLHCGIQRHSTEAIQSHMRSKGHCTLNLNREPELAAFWEDEVEMESKQEANSLPLHEELRLPSGKVVGLKSMARSQKIKRAVERLRTRRELQEQPVNHSPGRPDEGIGRESGTEDDTVMQGNESDRSTIRLREPILIKRSRSEAGVVGVSTQQRRALLATDKREQKNEAAARREGEWVREKVANHQKTYRPAGPMRPCG